MKGTNLGEFQELVLLTVGSLYPEAYGVAIKKKFILSPQKGDIKHSSCSLESKVSDFWHAC